ALLLGQRQAVEIERRLRRGRELPLEPRRVVLDRSQDVRLRRAGPHDELGRRAIPEVDAVLPHTRRAAYVQLDQASAEVDEAHRTTVGVAPDGNIRDTAIHAPGDSCVVPLPPA